jgi:HD-like signal output (HDOD) protein/FixJ family two-component response regulator
MPMTSPVYRALVVDDEPAVRRLAMCSLEREGFACEAASDGLAALELLERRLYDLVVTDLRMPNCHGHALAVRLLAKARRPVVAVLTGVAEPKLAKDLIARGVDEIVFKPVDFTLFSAKMRALLNRRAELAPVDAGSAAQVHESAHTPGDTVDLDAKLANVSRILPLNPIALDILGLSSDRECDVQRIVSAVSQNPSLAAEVLRLANSSLYNPAGERIADLEAAVLRIGQKQVGELALASNALAVLTSGMLPWINGQEVSRYSIAASQALEVLVSDGGHRNISNGLLLGVMMHSLGRVALGTLFPQSYDRMLTRCNERNATLSDQEVLLFGESQTAVMARLLRLWRVPPDAYLPLKYVDDNYASLVRLSEPLRTKTELIKLAVLAGRLAVSAWAAWDLVELPSSVVMMRLRIESFRDVVEAVRRNRGASPDTSPGVRRSFTYYHLAGGSDDYFALVMESLGIKLSPTSRDICEADPPVLVNCLDAPLHRLSSRMNPGSGVRPLIVCNADAAEKCSQFGIPFPLPGSFSSLSQLIDGVLPTNDH